MIVRTWSGSEVELTARVLPRWALGWVRHGASRFGEACGHLMIALSRIVRGKDD